MLHRLRALPGLALALLVAPLAALGAACASGGASLPPGGGGDDLPDQICLLNNCAADYECQACTEGRRTCLIAEGRCVACDPETGGGCPEGEVCTRWGACVADGVTCPSDDHGDPLVTCVTSTDCLACDPLHQICDTGSSRCVACTLDDTSACQSTDTCVGGRCVARCPYACTVDADCENCGVPGHEAPVCNAHRCSECSDARPCPAGFACSPQGTCVSVCGTDGDGACGADADCTGCGAPGFVCHGAGTGAGTCGPAAATCADLGAAAPAVPAPWDAVTQACTTDAGCAGVTAPVAVGEILRDMTGIGAIGDASVNYPMATCGDVKVGTGANVISCGVCVPCEVDADCGPIDVEPIAEALFGPSGSVDASYLSDQVFGPNERRIYMYCETIGAGYGVCSACPGYLNDCSVGDPGGGGTCDHDPCTSGGPLGTDCDACAAALCQIDSYCCTTAWDSICISEVEASCGMTCGGGAGCAHSECVAGPALADGCSPCASTVCAADSYCCATEWDAVCVNEAATMCDVGCGGGTCAHPECEAGDALTSGCSSCATKICQADDYCCTTAWDSLCVDAVDATCGFTCP